MTNWKPGYDSRQGNRFFSSPRYDGFGANPRPLSNWYRKKSPGVNRPGCEADQLPLSSYGVKNAWSHTSSFSILLHVVVFN